MPPFDPYEVLDVPRDADPVTVRRAYQRLARRLHPDLRPGDAEAERRYEEVARAYRILADPDLRRRWEAGLAEAGRRAGGPAGQEEAGGGRGRGVQSRLTLESFLEVHAEWISSEPGDPRGDHLTAELTLDFAEAVRGVTTSFSVQRERECEGCGGEGEELSGAPCERCAGRGVVVDLDRIRVRIPQGVEEGSRLRLPGKGNPPAAKEAAGAAEPVDPGGGEPGDLYLTVRVRPHPYFRRRGLDVLGDLPVTFAEAALGADLEVPTLDGPVKVRLPAGTSGGQRFRLRGRGVTLPSGRAGDHYYTVKIAVPDRLDDETRSLIERLPRQEPRRELPKEPV